MTSTEKIICSPLLLLAKSKKVEVRRNQCSNEWLLDVCQCLQIKLRKRYDCTSETETIIFFFVLWHYDPTRVMASSFLRFLGHTQRRTTVGRTPLDEWSARRRDLYLTTHNTHNRQTSMHPVRFEPTISAGERPQTYALDRAATGTGETIILELKN